MLYPSGFWNLFMERWYAPARKYAERSTMGSIWHSTYYTLPEHWKGRMVVTIVDMIQEKFPAMFSDARNDQLRERKQHCIRSADLVICISETTCQDVQSYYGIPFERTRVVYLAHSEAFSRRVVATGEGVHSQSEPFILFVGTRDVYKNFSTFLRAYSTWRLRDEIALMVVGLPWIEAEKHLISELGLSGRVRLISGVNDHALCSLYNQAVAYVYPSLYEGFGIPLLEAMACGCPVVASQIPATLEVASDIPYYFEPEDIGSLRSALDEAVCEGRDAERVIRGLKHADGFSWQHTARQTLDIYYSLM